MCVCTHVHYAVDQLKTLHMLDKCYTIELKLQTLYLIIHTCELHSWLFFAVCSPGIEPRTLHMLSELHSLPALAFILIYQWDKTKQKENLTYIYC